MTIQFSYEKSKVMQGLRYHFVTRPELRFMIILVNVFALLSAILFFLQKITPFAFFLGAFLWLALLISVWFLLPGIIYRKTATFKDHFSMNFEEDNFSLGNERGTRSWPWKTLSTFKESPFFFHLYFDSRSFFLVPKSGCTSKEQVNELRILLRKKIRKA